MGGDEKRSEFADRIDEGEAEMRESAREPHLHLVAWRGQGSLEAERNCGGGIFVSAASKGIGSVCIELDRVTAKRLWAELGARLVEEGMLAFADATPR